MADLLVGLVAGLLLCFSVSVEFTDRVAKKERFQGNLSAIESDVANQVQVVQAKKDRVAVLERQINALQAVEKESFLASNWVSFLDGTVPSTVSITKLSASKDVLTINGFTKAVSSLATWVDQMEDGNHLFHSVDLITLAEPSSSGKDEKEGQQRHFFEIKALVRGVSDASR